MTPCSNHQRFRFMDTHAETMLGLFVAGEDLTAGLLHRALRRDHASEDLTIGAVYRALAVLERAAIVELSVPAPSPGTDTRVRSRLEESAVSYRVSKMSQVAESESGAVSAACYRLTTLGETMALVYRLRCGVERRMDPQHRAWLATQMRALYQAMYQASR